MERVSRPIDASRFVFNEPRVFFEWAGARIDKVDVHPAPLADLGFVKLQSCYVNAIETLVKCKGSLYVEGIVVPRVFGIPFSHAWNYKEETGHFDVTEERFGFRGDHYAIFAMTAVQVATIMDDGMDEKTPMELYFNKYILPTLA